MYYSLYNINLIWNTKDPDASVDVCHLGLRQEQLCTILTNSMNIRLPKKFYPVVSPLFGHLFVGTSFLYNALFFSFFYSEVIQVIPYNLTLFTL